MNKSVTLDTSFRQGELDGLCGLYAIANAAKYIHGDTLKESAYKKVFETSQLRNIFADGMDDSEFSDHLERCSKFCKIKYFQITDTEVIRSELINERNSTCAIVAVEKSNLFWDVAHFTVIVSATGQYYTFYDSVFGQFRASRDLFSFKREKDKIRIFRKSMYFIY